MASLSVTWGNPPGLEKGSYLLTLNDGIKEDLVFTESLAHTFTELQAHAKYTVGIVTALPNGRKSEALSKVVDMKGVSNL